MPKAQVVLPLEHQSFRPELAVRLLLPAAKNRERVGDQIVRARPEELAGEGCYATRAPVDITSRSALGNSLAVVLARLGSADFVTGAA